MPRPDDLAGRGELIQERGAIVAHAPRQDEGLPGARRDRNAGQLFDRGKHAVDALEGARQVLPGGQEPGERGLRHRFDAPADRGE